MGGVKIGDALLNRVEEVRILNKISYFTKDEDLLAVNRYWLYPHFINDSNEFDLVFHSWIVEVDGRVILIDPCHGGGIPHPVPYFNMLDSPYLERMQASGYRPEDVDFVVCTHLHHDHCGWNTRLRAGKWVPTFPKARYVIQRLEYDNWAGKYASLSPDDLNRGVFERAVEPVVRAGLADLVSGSHRLTPGVSVEAAPGHTLGHQMVHLVSAGQQAFFTGDCFHHPIQLAEPTVFFAEAEDTDKLVASRRKLVELSAELNAYLIAAHTPAPYAVRASRVGRTLHFSAGF